ncbi:MAG: SHOCT domain-containing protein [Gammaproteobacteria bacterium]|nr:SHOCT domain-containing protein [Gammaproteobacteria bacterium]
MFGNSGGFGFGFGGIFMWIFWILIIVAIVALFRGMSNSRSGTSSSEGPIEILRKRYANGEISDEEFEHRRKELEK